MTDPKQCPTCGSLHPEIKQADCSRGTADAFHDTPASEICPTCGSDDPQVRGWMDWKGLGVGRECDDAFHDTPASEICPTCGSDEPLVVGDDDLRLRCIDAFHDTPVGADPEHIKAGEADIEAGHTTPAEDTFNRLRSKYPAASGGDDTPASERCSSIDPDTGRGCDFPEGHPGSHASGVAFHDTPASEDVWSNKTLQSRHREASEPTPSAQQEYDSLMVPVKICEARASEAYREGARHGLHQQMCDCEEGRYGETKKRCSHCADCDEAIADVETDERAHAEAQVAEAVREEREASHAMLITLAENETSRGVMIGLHVAADAIQARGKRLGRDMTESTDWNVE